MIGQLPLVSVVLPTRNRAHLIQRSIGSILGQSYANLELIVINDASTDDTREKLSGISDPRLRIIHRETNGGASAARNVGIAAANGELIAFNDDDDIWLVEKLQKQVSALQNAGPDVAWCLCCLFRLKIDGVRYIGGDSFIQQLDFSQGIGHGGPDWGLIATPGWLVDRGLLQRLGGFDERIRSWDDWELGLRLSEASKFTVVDEPLWIQDWILGSGLTRAERVRASDMRIIMQKHARRWQDSRQVSARHYYAIGRVESLYDPAPAGRAELYRALRLNPLRLRVWVALAMSYLGQNKAMLFANAIRRVKEFFK